MGAERTALRYGTIVVIGGGCYGRYYLRQLRRAATAGAIGWERLLLVDRDPHCAATAMLAADAGSRAAPPAALQVAEWGAFLDAWLPGSRDEDAIVPSPLMPHVFYEYLERRARSRWPTRVASRVEALAAIGTPWERAAPDGTRFVSHADWICPVNCIEPARCPVTRGVRDWSMPVTIARAAPGGGTAPRLGPFIFACTHRAYGVGMVDASAIVAADTAIAAGGQAGPVEAIIATVSHCHGAVAGLRIAGAPVPLRPRSGEIS